MTLTGKTIRIQDVDGFTQCSNLMARIQDAEGIPQNQQRLIFQGHEIGRYDNLDECAVLDEAVMHLVLRLRLE
jgi:hypothetical protein